MNEVVWIYFNRKETRLIIVLYILSKHFEAIEYFYLRFLKNDSEIIKNIEIFLLDKYIRLKQYLNYKLLC